MRCSLCGSKLSPLITDLPFKVSDTSIVILKGLPVLQCDNCREYLLNDLVMKRVDEILQRADAAGIGDHSLHRHKGHAGKFFVLVPQVALGNENGARLSLAVICLPWPSLRYQR